MEKQWDSLVGTPIDTKIPVGKNPYSKQIESDDAPQSSEDQNLYTAFVLISSHGLDSNIGKMMASYAEEALPHTIAAVFKAFEHAEESDRTDAQKFLYTLRGIVMFVYAWAYVMSRTKQLSIKDQDFYPNLIKFSATSPNSDDRKNFTKSAENKFETTLGTLLHAIESAKKAGHRETVTFFEGSILACYVLANMYYGQRAAYTGQE